jgi:hypothetical protein
MPRLLAIKTAKPCKLWLRYDGGAEGTVDLSDLAGQGVLSLWRDPGVFEKATLASHGAVCWGDDADLCPDMLYLRLTGKEAVDLYPILMPAS